MEVGKVPLRARTKKKVQVQIDPLGILLPMTKRTEKQVGTKKKKMIDAEPAKEKQGTPLSQR